MCFTASLIKLGNSHLDCITGSSPTTHSIKKVIVLKLPASNILTQSKLFSKHGKFVDHLFSNDILIDNTFKHLSRFRKRTYLRTKSPHNTCRLLNDWTTQIAVNQITHGISSTKSCLFAKILDLTTPLSIAWKSATKCFNVVSTNNFGVPLVCLISHLGLAKAELIDNNVVVTSITSCFHQTQDSFTRTPTCFEKLSKHVFTDHWCRVTRHNALVNCSKVASVSDNSARFDTRASYCSRFCQARCNNRVISRSPRVSF